MVALPVHTTMCEKPGPGNSGLFLLGGNMKPKLIRVACCKNCKHYDVEPSLLPYDDGCVDYYCKLHNINVDEDQKCKDYERRKKDVQQETDVF